jgi:hypothetical protein
MRPALPPATEATKASLDAEAPHRLEPGGPAGTIAGVSARYRCSACGNLTRFDVTLRRRVRAFHHFSLGGELAIEHEDVLSEEVEDVACRWCGTGREVEQLGDGVSR